MGETTSKQNLLSMSSHGLTEQSRRSSTTTVRESCQHNNNNNNNTSFLCFLTATSITRLFVPGRMFSPLRAASRPFYVYTHADVRQRIERDLKTTQSALDRALRYQQRSHKHETMMDFRENCILHKVHLTSQSPLYPGDS